MYVICTYLFMYRYMHLCSYVRVSSWCVHRYIMYDIINMLTHRYAYHF